MKIEKSIVINSPVQSAFDFISDPERRPLFIPNLVSIGNVSVEPQGVGRTWDYEFSMGGILLRGRGTCTTFEPGAKYGIRTEGGIDTEWLYSFAPEGSGTRLTVSIEYEPPSSVLGKVANTVLLNRLNERAADQGLENLRILLEG